MRIHNNVLDNSDIDIQQYFQVFTSVRYVEIKSVYVNNILVQQDIINSTNSMLSIDKLVI